MNISDQIQKTLIELTIDNKDVLFLLLDRDGTINRTGNATTDNEDNNFYIGTGKDNQFEKLIKLVDEEMINFCGHVYDIPQKQGRLSKLKVVFNGFTINTGFEVHYGEDSQGPPKPIVQFVAYAMHLTNDWMKEQKEAAIARGDNTPIIEEVPATEATPKTANTETVEEVTNDE